jgi:hypothetical protein
MERRSAVEAAMDLFFTNVHPFFKTKRGVENWWVNFLSFALWQKIYNPLVPARKSK